MVDNLEMTVDRYNNHDDRKTYFSFSIIKLFLCLSFLIGFTSNTFASLPVVWDEWVKSVIRLEIKTQSGRASGTAFAINNNGNYITTHHVIEMAIKDDTVFAIEPLEPQEKRHKATIVWKSKEHNLAMVHVKDWKKKPLKISNGDFLNKGQAVYAIGFPEAANKTKKSYTEPTIKKGILSALKEHSSLKHGENNVKTLEHDASVNSGNSGGPLADACGRVIGVNKQKELSYIKSINTAEGVFFSVNSIELITLLDKYKISYEKDNSKCTKETAIIGLDSLSNTILIFFIGLGFFILLAFFYLFRKVKKASPDGRINSRVISHMIRERIGGGKTNTSQQSRPGYDNKLGRMVYPNEPEYKGSKSQLARKVAYLLVPQRKDLHLPVLELKNPGNYRLGRSQNANTQLIIPNQYVSSQHAIIIVNPDMSIAIEAIESTNGTQIAGQLLPTGEIRSLSEGETIRFGHDEVIYRLHRG